MNAKPPAPRAARRFLPLFIGVGLLLSGYGLCWAVGMLYVPAQVVVYLPRYDLQANARATLYVAGTQHESRSWPSPLPSPLNFDWQISGGFLWRYWDTRGDWLAVIEVQGCQPLTVTLTCSPWTLRAPDFTVFGAWGASYSKECAGSGHVLCNEQH